MGKTVCSLLVRDMDSPSELVVLGFRVVDFPENFPPTVIRVYTKPCGLVNSQPSRAESVANE